MATNYSQLIEVVVALKDQSGQAAQQIQAGINGIVEALEKLNASSAKKSIDPITSALKGIQKFSDPAKNQIESLTTSFNNLTTSVKSAKEALAGLKVPQGVLNALQTISTPPVAVTTPKVSRSKKSKEEVTPASLDAQAQATAALAAQQTALAATDEAVAKADAEQGKAAEKVTAQMRAQEAAVASARTNLMTWKAAVEQITASLNKHVEAVRAQGSTNAEMQSSANYAKTALTELDRIIKSAEAALRKFTGESYSSNEGAKALAQELTVLAAALKRVYQESSGKLIVGQELTHQQTLIKRAQAALDEYHQKIVAASRILKEKGVEGVSTDRAERLLDGINTAGQKVVRTFKDVSENVDIRPKGFNQLFSAATHLDNYVSTRLGPALNKAIDVSPAVTQAKNDLRTLETSLAQASVRFKEIQQKVFKPGSTAALQPGLTTGDLKEYEIALRGVLTNIDKHFRKVASTSNPFAKNTEDAKAYEQQINAINAAYGRLSVSLRNAQRSVTKQISNLGEYGDAWIGVNKSTGLQINSLGDLTGSAATIGKKLTQGLTNFATRTGGSVESVQRVTEAVTDLETQMIRFRSGVVTWSIGLLMMSTAIAAPFRAAIDILTQLTDALAQAGAITAATTEEFIKLEKAAFDMGRTTRFTSLEAAQALVQLGRNGFNATESIALLPTALRLAQAAAIDFGQATDIVTNIMTAFNMSVEDFPRAADVLTKAFTSSNATLENLGFGFTYVGSLAKGLGADFDDLIGALAKLHDAGFKGCHDDQTEIMTKDRGFVLFKDLLPEDQVMTINKDTLAMEWQHTDGKIYEYEVNEPLFYINTKSLDYAVTDNHRLFIETRSGARKIIEAKDFKEGRFFRTGIWNGIQKDTFVLPGFTQDRGNWEKEILPLEISMRDWVEFLGWYLSEGSLGYESGNYKIVISQSDANPEKLEILSDLLNRLPFNFRKENGRFITANHQLYKELESYGKGFANKRVPEYVKELSSDLLKSFYEAYRLGDGDSQGNLYTSNNSLAEDLYEIVLKCGYAAQKKQSIAKGEKRFIGEREITATENGYILQVSTCHTHPYVSIAQEENKKELGQNVQNSIEWKPYKGRVYSVKVPNTLVFVRRNGKGLFSGNTMAGTALRGALDGLFNPTKQEAEVMKELSAQLGLIGFNIRDVQGDFVGWVDIIRQLENASFTSEQALKLFGQRAGPGVAALLQIGSGELENYLKTLKNSEGITKRLSDVMENTLKGAFLQVTSALEGLGENFGRSVEPTLKVLANLAADIINTFTDIRVALGPITVVFDNLLGILVPLAVAVGSLTFAWFVMIVPVKQLTNALTLLFGAAKSAQATLLGIPEGMNASAGELTKLNAARTKAVALARQIGIIEAEQLAGNQKNVSQLAKLNAELAKSEAAYRAITLKIIESNAASAEALAIEQARLQGLNAATAATAGAAARVQATAIPSVFRTGLVDKKTNVPLDFDVELGYARGSTQDQIDKFRKDIEKRASQPVYIPLNASLQKGWNADFDKVWNLNIAAIKKQAAEQGLAVGNTFGKSIAAGFKKFMSGGFASSIALLVSSFTSVFGANFLLAVVAIEQLIGANIKWKDSIVKLGAVLVSFFKTLTYFKGLGLLTLSVTGLTVAYQYFKSTSEQVIKSLSEEGEKLIGLNSELQNVRDRYEQLAEKKKQFEEAGKLGDTGVVASLNREVVTLASQLEDVYQGFIKLGVFTGKEIFYTVKTEVVDGKEVKQLVAVFSDGTEVVQGFDAALDATFSNLEGHLQAVSSIENVVENAITENNIKLVNEYIDAIKNTQNELIALEYYAKLRAGQGSWEALKEAIGKTEGAWNKFLLVARIPVPLPFLDEGVGEIGQQQLRTYKALSDQQRQLAQLRLFETKDLAAQKLWIDKIANGDQKRAEFLYQQLEAGKAYNKLLEQQIRLNRANRLGPQLGALATSLDEVLKEGYEGLGKLGDVLSDTFEFNTEGIDKNLESLNSALEQTKSQLQAQYDNERENLNQTFQLLYTYGQERQDLYDRLTASGYKYALEDFKQTVNFEFKKAQAVRDSIAERDVLFSQYYADQQKYLTAVEQDYQGLGKFVPKELSKYLNIKGATDDYASLNQEASTLTENINESTESTKDLSSTTKAYTEDYIKALLLRNALDTKAAEHVKKTLEEKIKVEEDVQKTLFDVRKKFSDKFLELEKNRVKVQKELELELIALKNFKPPKIDTGIFKTDVKEFQKITKEEYDALSKEEQRTYRNSAIDQQFRDFKERIKLTKEYKDKIIELGYELRKAYSIQDVEGFDNIKDKIVDLVKDAKDAAKDGKLNVKDLGLDLLLSNTRNLSNALKSELGADYKKAGQTIQEALTASISKTEELRNSLARVEQALLIAFSEKGVLQGFVTQLGGVSDKVKEAAANIKELADTLKVLQNARVEIEVVVKQGKEVNALTQSQEQLKRFSEVYKELTQNVNEYVIAGAGKKETLSTKIGENLKELSNIAPSLEKMLPSLAAIEGMDFKAIGELGAALSGFANVSVEQFNKAKEAGKDSDAITRKLLIDYNQLGVNVVNAGDAIAGSINKILPALKKTYEDNAVAIRDTLNKVIPDALRNLNDQIGSIKSLTIDVSGATANLGIVRASLEELIRLKQEVEGKITTPGQQVPQVTPQPVTVPVVIQPPKQVPDLGLPEKIVIPVEFQGVKEYEEWYTEFVNKYKELPDISETSNYDYKKALAAGVKPERQPDGEYHWPSKTLAGEWLKKEGHPTRWMEESITKSGEYKEAITTNVSNTLEGVKNQIEEKFSLIINIDLAVQALDVVIAKLKEIVEWIKSIGKTPVQISQQGQVQQGQTQQGQVAIPAQVVVEPVQLQQTVEKAADKLQPIKSKGLATLRDGSILQDDKQLYEEFNRQLAKGGHRQLDLDKIPTQIRAAGKSLYEVVNLYNDELERTGELFRIEPPMIDFGQSYDEMLKEFVDRNIRNTKGVKIPAEFEFKDLVKPTFDWKDYRVPVIADWKLSPEDLIKDQKIEEIRVPLLPSWEVFPEQLSEQDYFKQFFEDQEVQIKPTFEEENFKQFFEDQDVQIKPTFENEYFKKFFEDQEVNIKPTFEDEYFKKFFEEDSQVSISVQPESEEKVLSGIEKIRQKAATSPLTLFFKPEISKDQKPEEFIPKGLFDGIKQAFNDFVKGFNLTDDIGNNLKFAFNKDTLEKQSKEFTQALVSVSSEMTSVIQQIQEKHKAVFEQGDATQAPALDALIARAEVLKTKEEELRAKMAEVNAAIVANKDLKLVIPEDANPLGSLIAAVTAGKDAIINSVTSITTSITAQFTPVLTQLQLAMNLGAMRLDVTGAVAAINQLINVLIQAINLKNQLSSGSVIDTGGETPIAENARGGYISGPGTATSDSILSWLSNGEYVMDALTTKFFGASFFRNLQGYARKGKIPEEFKGTKFNKGGSVDFKKLISGFRLPKFSKGGYVGRIKKEQIVIPTIKLPKFATGGLVGATSGFDYAKIGMSRQASTMSGTPVNLTIYDHKYELKAAPSVADQLRKALSLENLKRGRR